MAFDPQTFGRGLMSLGQSYGTMVTQDADRRIEAMKQQVLREIRRGDTSLDRMVQAHSVDTSDKRLALAEKADVREEAGLTLRQDAAKLAKAGKWKSVTVDGGSETVSDGGVVEKLISVPKPDRIYLYNDMSMEVVELMPDGSHRPTNLSPDQVKSGNVPGADGSTKTGTEPLDSIYEVDTTTTWEDEDEFREVVKQDIINSRSRRGLPPLTETALKEAVERVVADQTGKRYVPQREKGGDAAAADAVVTPRTSGPRGNPRGMLKQRRSSDVLDAKRTAEDRINAESFANSAEKVEEKVAEILDDKEVAKKTNTSKTVTRPLPNAGTLEEYENAEVMEIDGKAVKIPKHSLSTPALAAQRLLMKELGLSRTEALKQWANHYWATTQPVEGVPIGPEDSVPAPSKSVVQSDAAETSGRTSHLDGVLAYEQSQADPVSAPKLSEEGTPSVVESTSTVKPDIDTLTTNRLPDSGPRARGFTPSAKSVIQNDSAVEQSNVGEKTEQGVYSMTSDEATKYVRDILAAVEGKVAKEDIRLHLLDLLGSIPPEKANTPFAHALAQALSERTYAELAAVPETDTPSPVPALGSSGKVDASPVVGEAVGEVEGQQRATPPLTQMTYAQAETAWGNIIQTLQGNKDKAGNRTHPDRIIANELLRILSTIPPEDGDAPYAKALGAAFYNLTKPLAGGTVETSVNIPSN
tara:strand:+ start:75 stop:2165 length:2091 start_codon:yes stop_codon:yes gene_type:complete